MDIKIAHLTEKAKLAIKRNESEREQYEYWHKRRFSKRKMYLTKLRKASFKRETRRMFKEYCS